MLGIYFSGTGNTKHCVEKLVGGLDDNALCVALEDTTVVNTITGEDFIVFGYPVQFSNAPKMVRDFIVTNASLWNGKKILCVATMGAFSGDGAGCSARLFKKYGADIVGGLHIRMPDSVCDSKALKKSIEDNRKLVDMADAKIDRTITQIKDGCYPKEGLNIFYHIAGLFGQRLWFYGKTKNYSSQLKISDECIGCGLCVSKCPMKNIRIENGKAVALGQCTMCYRCISHCPKKAITLLGKEVTEQCQYEKYAH